MSFRCVRYFSARYSDPACIFEFIHLSSRGGLEVEQWSDNRTLSISVDQSPLWALNIVSLVCDKSMNKEILFMLRDIEERLYDHV